MAVHVHYPNALTILITITMLSVMKISQLFSANANYLMSHSNAKIMLEGHTDPRGSREYNIGLGERRAKAVAA